MVYGFFVFVLNRKQRYRMQFVNLPPSPGLCSSPEKNSVLIALRVTFSEIFYIFSSLLLEKPFLVKHKSFFLNKRVLTILDNGL